MCHCVLCGERKSAKLYYQSSQTLQRNLRQLIEMTIIPTAPHPHHAAGTLLRQICLFPVREVLLVHYLLVLTWFLFRLEEVRLLMMNE